MPCRKTAARAAAAAVTLVLVGAGATAPAAADQSHGNLDRPARAQQNHEAAHAKRAEAGDQRRERRDGADRPGDRRRDGADRSREARGERSDDHGDHGLGDGRGNGHTPVTVCHLLGNGGYIELTFDENALDAHLAHGDLHPVPAGGCPETDGDTTLEQDGDPLATPGTDLPETDVAEQAVPEPAAEPQPTTQAEVLGVQRFQRSATTTSPEVAGVDAVAGGGPALLGPVAGILPQTGAPAVGLAVLAGLAAVAGGAAVLRRRRAGA